MATRLPIPEELVCLEELEGKLTQLSAQAELMKEEVRGKFQELHSSLAVRENFLVRELDGVVTRARQEVLEKRTGLQQLYTAREGHERDLTENKYQRLLDSNLRAIENEIGEEISKSVSVTWLELYWKKGQLEQSVVDVCEIVPFKEKPITRIDYSAKLSPVWSRDATDASEITHPHQIAIDNRTQNIFVADKGGSRIQVFDGEGNHLYQISTPQHPVGIVLTDEYIFVSTGYKLIIKIETSNNDIISSNEVENIIWGLDINEKTHLYGCIINDLSVCVFDQDLDFLRRIKLHTTQVTDSTRSYSIKLFEDNMYVMFGKCHPFHLQIFTLEGQLVRCVIDTSEDSWSYYFSIDLLGNIVVGDWGQGQINIFTNEGKLLHVITSDMLPGDQEFEFPFGVAIDCQNRIIVAHKNMKGNLLAF